MTQVTEVDQFPDLAALDTAAGPGGLRSVSVQGELTRSTVGALDDVLAEAPPPGTTLLVDLATVPFIDLSGARALLALYDTLRCQGVRVVLCEPTDTLLRVFDVMEVDPPVEVTWR